MSKTPRDWTKTLLKELFKHAQKDQCYTCRQILRAMGLDPEKRFEDLFKED